jgi:NAD(P)-dependent dehydrogenase (short-subunit alcohol dehydrogenase family)
MPIAEPSATPFLQLFDFSGKRVCVTGAASGIGLATARRFGELGGLLVLADCDANGLEKAAGELGPDTRSIVYDQADLASIEALAEAAGQIDILFANAGILLYEPLLELNWDKLRRVIDVNLVGTIALVRLVAPMMVAAGGGAIIVTGSQLSFNGAECRSVYAATKAALAQLVKTAALEWGRHGVRVNCLAPGRTITKINRHLLSDPAHYREGLARIPLGRYGQPVDIANAAVFLASPAAGYVTGHTLVVDGGWILP